MRSTRSSKYRLRIATALVAMLMVGLMAPSASATIVIPKPFTMTVSPSSSAAGASKQFTATFKNWWLQKLGSADLSVPAAYTISSVITSKGTATVVGNTVKLRNLSLPFLKSFTVKVTAVAACASSTGNVWSAAAKAGANFTGAAFLLLSSASHRSTAVTGSCSLQFVTQPADTGPGAIITSVASDPDGAPVQVGVYDGANNLRTAGAATTVSMAIGSNPGGGTLSGTPSAATAGGVATFADLSIDEPGDGYTLVASAPGLGSLGSSAFSIAGLVQACEPNVDCTGSLSEDGTGAFVNALADESSPVLTMSLTPGGIDCDGYTEQSATLTFNVTSSREKEVTMSFDTDLYDVDPDDFQVCFESDTAFTDREGDTVFLGLLPDCTVDEYPSFTRDSVAAASLVENDPPCVEGRSSDGSVVSVTFRTPAGDPKGRV